MSSSSFFFKYTETTEIYTLSLHDALPISLIEAGVARVVYGADDPSEKASGAGPAALREAGVEVVEADDRSEEHTSELQSLAYLVCRLLLEKKKNNKKKHPHEHRQYHTILP